MSARILKGSAVAKELRAETAKEVAEFKSTGAPEPCLAVILAGEDPASKTYVRNKIKACEEVGIASELIRLEGEVEEDRIKEAVSELNARKTVDGILVQLPLPGNVDSRAILNLIDPAKDVDGLHPVNAGKMLQGEDSLQPCTPTGIMELLERSGIEIKGSRAVVLGRSNIVGKPMALMLLKAHATVTICHSRTRDLPKVTSEADILVAAVGKAGLVTREYVRPGATVVDVGIHRLSDKSEVARFYGEDSPMMKRFLEKGSALVGDVHPREVPPVAGALTPVPGGVGPLTIACLLRNTLKSAKSRRGRGSS